MKTSVLGMVEKMLKFALGFGVVVFCASNCFAADQTTLTQFVGNVQTGVLTPILQIAVSVCYLAGLVFAIIGIMKLKAHKDNPTQVPISMGVMHLAVGIGLVFFPAVISMIMNSLGLGGSGGAGSLKWSGNSITGS